MTHEDLPAEEESVRRLLAASAEMPPLPDDVAARLDATLRSLVDERADTHDTAPTVPTRVVNLARRRQRRLGGALIAAASVAVVAYGVGNVVTKSGQDESTASSDAASSSVEDQKGTDGGSDAGSDVGARKAPTPGAVHGLTRRVPRLRTSTLRSDVRRALAITSADVVTESHGAAPDVPWRTGVRRDCDVPERAKDDLLIAVRLNGQPATLLVRNTEAATREAQVYSCADAVIPLASTFVASP